MHRVEHIETLVDADLPRFAALDVAASMQPLHMEGLDEPDAPSAWHDGLSPGRAERAFRHGDIARSRRDARRSARTGWSPTTTRASGWRGRGCGARRVARTARRTCRSRRSAAEQTLHGYTTHAARVNGDESVYGRLKPGLRADITAFARIPARPIPTSCPTCRSS